jgi:RNA polymerase sigma-70 factor, ECF subfamily
MTSAAGTQVDAMHVVVMRAAKGDHAAFTTIVHAHHTDMIRVAFLVCGDRETAHEAVAAAWPLAWRRLGALREPERLRPWLVSIAANEARRLVRRHAVRSVREIPVESAEPRGSGDPAARVGDLDLKDALRRLSAEDRALLSLRYIAGLNSTELARATGRSASGTRARLARLLDRLRSELTDV